MASGSDAEADCERLRKVRKIFRLFDANNDEGLSRKEMAALVISVNPRVKFSGEQINAILDEVFRTYADFIDAPRGLTFQGLLRTYDDGAGDVDRDFEALRLVLDPADSIPSDGDTKAPAPASHPHLDLLPTPAPAATLAFASSSSSIADEVFLGSARRRHNVAPWSLAPNTGVRFACTWNLLDDLHIIIKRLEGKMEAFLNRKNGKRKNGKKEKTELAPTDTPSESGWSKELGSTGSSKDMIRPWEDLGQDYVIFQEEVRNIRHKANASSTQEEAFDGHLAIGRTLFDHGLCKEALTSFKRAAELKQTDARPHFHCGNILYSLGYVTEAKEAFGSALAAAAIPGSQWSYLLPQIHVNLGVAYEGEGMLFCGSEHYREATDLNPKHYRAWKLLGSALFGAGEHTVAEKALSEAVKLRPDYADAHCDLASALHAIGADDRAIQEYQTALDLKPDHVDSLYNLGGLFKDIGRYQRAAEMYSKVLTSQPDHWRAQLNKAVALLGAGEKEESVKAFKDALKMTNRAEMYDVLLHLKHLEKTQHEPTSGVGKAGGVGFAEGARFVVVDASRFKAAEARAGIFPCNYACMMRRKGRSRNTDSVSSDGLITPCRWLACALVIRQLQKQTRLDTCDVAFIKAEIGTASARKRVKKDELEKTLRRMLPSLSSENFQGAIKSINERILAFLDGVGSTEINLGFFFAVIAPICSGSIEKRKQVAFDALVWHSSSNCLPAQISHAGASLYLKVMQAVYMAREASGANEELRGEDNPTMVSFEQFSEMFDDCDWGFGIIKVLAKLELCDRIRHDKKRCNVCLHPIIGLLFKEVSSRFTLCSYCYSECKVPSAHVEKEEFCFKEYSKKAETPRNNLMCFRSSNTLED